MLFDIKNVPVVLVLVPTCTPFWNIFPLTYRLPPIPAPPVTVNAPVVVLVLAVVLVIEIAALVEPPLPVTVCSVLVFHIVI